MAQTSPPSSLSTLQVVPAASPDEGPSLLVIRQGVAGRVSLGDKQVEWVIGRSHDCDVCIDDSSLSRRHAVLRRQPRWSLEELGSVNGTKVNGQAIPAGQRVELAAGAVLELGLVTAVLQGASEAPQPPGGSLVLSPRTAELHRLLERVAGSALSVLLLGETGVGKEVFAEELHRLSPRRGGPLVKLNCAAMPEALLESELFGHEKGSFTGSTAAKVGLLESASGGTVLLDEVGEMPLAVQAKLLRVLEDRQVLRVGGLKPRPIDVRFAAATNRDLQSEAERGTFRRDLYFRLNGISLLIPPLRERPEEIEPLARLFAGNAAKAAGLPCAPPLEPAAVEALRGHGWPGNVRELRNVVERATALSGGAPISPAHLLLDAPRPGEPRGELREGRAQAERAMILDALARAGGNQTEAARLLGVSRRTLLYKLDALDIERPRKGR